MKALFIGNTSSSMLRFRGDVMAFFKQQGWDVVVVAPSDEHSQVLLDLGLEHIPLINLDRKGLRATKDIKLFFELLGIYGREKPDLVFHYTIKPNIWGTLAVATTRFFRINSSKTISMVSGLGYAFIRKNWLTYVVTLLYRFAFTFANRVIFLNTDDMHDFFRLRILEPHDNKAMLIGGEGVDTKYFSSDRPSQFPSKPTFLFVGRLLIDKGITEFVETARLIKEKRPGCTFQILGAIDPGNPAGISQDKLQSWIREGIVSYLGTADDVRPFFENATAIVLPSYLEGSSRVLMEALAMAKPIIASDVRGCREFVDVGKNGYLVTPKSSQSLAQAVIQILSLDEPKLMSFSQYSRQKSGAYCSTVTISAYKELADALSKGAS